MAASRPSPSKRKKKKNNGKGILALIALAILAGLAIWIVQKPNAPQKKSGQIAPPSQALKRVTNANLFQVLTATKTNTPPITNALTLPKTNLADVPSLPAKTNAPIPKPALISSGERTAQTILEAQIALARMGISPGSIDGAIGSQTRAALRAFQEKMRLPATGELDPATKSRLIFLPPVYTELLITEDDLRHLQPLGTNWFSKSRQTRLDYETVLELASERVFSHPNFIRQLNPNIDWTNVRAGTRLRVPNVEKPAAPVAAAFVRIHLAGRNLEAFDDETNLLAHFPCSIAQRVDKRPVGELHVERIAVGPDYTFNPEIFPELAETRALKSKLIISPGPNNPVGTIWIGLDKPGYGIHGTPAPESVGRTESHGCFRLANWNAEYLVQLVSIGTPVFVAP